MTQDKGTVVISGASTGIGAACAEHLSQRGFTVLAGVRSEADHRRISALNNPHLRPLFLDVTSEESIAEAVEIVSETTGEAGLSALVNNAGIVAAGPIEYVSIDEVRGLFEVNVLGLMATVKAFIPLLRQAQGRVVNIGSISGRSAMPFMSPYASSKFAVEAISDSLRVELRPWNIEVCLLEPGSVSTPLFDKYLASLDAYIEGLPPKAKELYGRCLAGVRTVAVENATKGHTPESIARTVERALTATSPKARYLCGEGPRQMLVLESLPSSMRDWVIDKALRHKGKPT